MINRICRAIATLGPIGYLPASGTLATMSTAGVLFVLSLVGIPVWLVNSVVLPGVAAATVIIHISLHYFDQHDPSEIVLDEVIGYLFAMTLFPHTYFWLIVVALGFRFFDILKPLGIKRLERFDGAVGIILDDLCAALYTQITLILCCIGYDLWIR